MKWILISGIVVINLFVLGLLKNWQGSYMKSETVMLNFNTSQLIWMPPYRDIERWTNRAPFHHMPYMTVGRIFLKRNRTSIIATAQKNCRCPPDNVLVVFVFIRNSKKDLPILEQTLEACRCKNYKRIGDVDSQGNVVVWNHWLTKIEVVLDYVANFVLPKATKYIIYADAFDTALVGDASNVVRDFESYDAELLTCNTFQSVPKVTPLARQQNISKFEQDAAPWSKYHAHLNAGGFMATVDSMRHYMKILKEEYGDTVEREKFDDQVSLKEMHMRFFPKIKVDSMTKIFTRVDPYMDKL